MSEHFTEQDFLPLQVAILTLSDSRGEDRDTSGRFLKESAEAAGHQVVAKEIAPDDRYTPGSLMTTHDCGSTASARPTRTPERATDVLRTEYQRARLQIGEAGETAAAVYRSRSSAVLSSVGWADGLGEIAPGQVIARGDEVDFIPLANLH